MQTNSAHNGMASQWEIEKSTTPWDNETIWLGASNCLRARKRPFTGTVEFLVCASERGTVSSSYCKLVSYPVPLRIMGLGTTLLLSLGEHSQCHRSCDPTLICPHGHPTLEWCVPWFPTPSPKFNINLLIFMLPHPQLVTCHLPWNLEMSHYYGLTFATKKEKLLMHLTWIKTMVRPSHFLGKVIIPWLVCNGW